MSVEDSPIQLMGNTSSTGNNLERYLQSIYSTQCEFSARDDIETGIEVLINQILSDCFKQNNITSCTENVRLLEEYELVKVGSYYEKTKNNFPNEFDFMVVFGEARTNPSLQDFQKLPLLNKVVTDNKAAYEYVTCKCKRPTSITVGRSRVSLRKPAVETQNPESSILKAFDVTHNGPAQTIQFNYIHSSDVSCVINVDLVFALRSSNVEDHLKRTQVHPDGFYETVLKNGRVHYIAKPIDSPVKTFLTLTEAEVHFMKHVLSRKHVQVYRLLKYLINGHDYNADQHGLSRHSVGFNITSYEIKCAVIHHHYSCRKSSRDVSTCVLDILYAFDSMLNPYKQPEFQTTFTKFLLQTEEQSVSLFSNTMLYGSTDQRKEIWQAFSVFIKRLENLKLENDSTPQNQLLRPFREALKVQKRVEERFKRFGMDANKTLFLRNSADFPRQK